MFLVQMYENCLKKFFKHPNVEVLGYLARAYFRQCYGSGPLSSGYEFAWGNSGTDLNGGNSGYGFEWGNSGYGIEWGK